VVVVEPVCGSMPNGSGTPGLLKQGGGLT